MSAAWPTRQLRDLAEVRVSNVDKKTHLDEQPIKLCNYMDVYSNEYVTSCLEFMEASATSAEIERFALNSGDVVITKDSETPDDIGIAAVIMEQIDRLVCGYHLALIRPRANELDSIYLAKQLSSSPVARYFAVHASGSTRYGLPVSVIESVAIPTPPKPEQTKIAEILSTADRAIEQTDTVIAKQWRIRKGLMQDLLTYGVDENGRLRSEKSHKFKNSALGKIPEEWWIASIGDLFEKRQERGKPGLPVMSVVMRDGLVERASVERRVESNLPAEGHALVAKGDIAYNMMRMWQGVLGRAQFDCLVSPAYVVLKPRDKINTHFAEWLFRDERSVLKFRRASRGVVDDRLRLYAHDLFAIEFAIPKSLDEQEAVAQRLDAIKDRIAKETALLEKYRRIRAGLMQDLLFGRKRVTELIGAKRKREEVYAGQ
jgi:type I restriction enzyme S subunit